MSKNKVLDINKKSINKSDNISDKMDLIEDFIYKNNINQFDLINVIEDLMLTSYYSIIEETEGEAIADKKMDILFDLSADVACAMYETAIEKFPDINNYELIVTAAIATSLIMNTIINKDNA